MEILIGDFKRIIRLLYIAIFHRFPHGFDEILHLGFVEIIPFCALQSLSYALLG